VFKKWLWPAKVLVSFHMCVCGGVCVRVRVQGFSQVFSRHPQNVFLAFQFTTKTFWEIIAKVFHKMKAHKFTTTTRAVGRRGRGSVWAKYQEPTAALQACDMRHTHTHSGS